MYQIIELFVRTVLVDLQLYMKRTTFNVLLI